MGKSRIVLKLGTNLLTNAAGGLNETALTDLARQIAAVWRDGFEILLVSSGSITAGRQILQDARRANRISGKSIVAKQSLAAVGQPALINTYSKLFAEYNITIAQTLISRHDLNSRLGYLNTRSTLGALLEADILPVINENDVVSVKEISGKVYGDNDRLSAMVANAMSADKLIMLGAMEGLYSADPHLNADAVLIKSVTSITADIERGAGRPHDERGSGGMVSKIEAARIAMSSGIEMIITSGLIPDVILRLCADERLGTYFKPHTSHAVARKRWMMTGFTEQSGQITVDDGARDALKKHGVSLLPAGVAAIRGEFKRGDIVAVKSTAGDMIAFGIANYDAYELEQIKGKNSAQIENVLGHNYGGEAIHRNNLTLV